MTLARTCSECGASLAGARPDQKTCGDKCRQDRSRRLRRLKFLHDDLREHNPEGMRAVAEMVKSDGQEIVRKVLGEELRPIVRDALTAEVLQSIAKMVGLTPRAVELMGEDLESEDAVIRQRAYTLIAKYTIGHPAIVTPEQAGAGQMVVNFNLPRPDSSEIVEEVEDVEEELKVCDMCNEDKPASSFAAGSDRCITCYEDWRQKVLERFKKVE